MSFSKEVKEELSKQISSARHCRIAEIAAILSMCGKVTATEQGQCFIKIQTENLTVARKYFMLIKETFHTDVLISVKQNHYLKKNKIYSLVVKDNSISKKILQATKLMDEQGVIQEDLSLIHSLVVQNTCCKRAFIRGAFLSAGSISDPEKTYHFEMITTTEQKAKQLQEMIRFFEIDAKIVLRKKYFVVYIKDGSQIVDILNIMEAHVSLMNLENVRILKEMRNSINRQVNCETANINKTVKAASKQLEDILYIKNTIGFGELSERLEEIARLRIEQPDVSLKELGSMLSTPIGKSGVNHRLRKLSIIADRLREQKEEE